MIGGNWPRGQRNVSYQVHWAWPTRGQSPSRSAAAPGGGVTHSPEDLRYHACVVSDSEDEWGGPAEAGPRPVLTVLNTQPIPHRDSREVRE